MEGELHFLIEKYFNNACSREELDRLFELASDGSDQLSEALRLHWNQTELDGEDYREYRATLFDLIPMHVGAPVRSMHRTRRFFRVAVVAAALVITLAVVWISSNRQGGVAKRLPRTAAVAAGIEPGGKRAILTLSDGKTINLAAAANGALAQQGDAKISKVGESIAYSANGLNSAVVYNTISTPRGGEYQLEMADGTKVWLNAASSLSYPTGFTGKDRTVELTGEAYFEVKHDASMPFHVKVKNADIEDLGTAFDINAYDDEPVLTTTVINGSVSFDPINDKRSFQVSAGQQVTAGSRDILVNTSADLDAVTAWKEGNFVFNSTSLEEIMRQIARWYDLRVQFEGSYQTRTFSGIVSRNSPLSEVLDIMKHAQIKFQEEGNVLIVGQ